MAEAALHCPKCHARMASLQRNGIKVERCATCRGVFLGETELARFMRAFLDAFVTGPPVTNSNDYPVQIYEGRHRRG